MGGVGSRPVIRLTMALGQGARRPSGKLRQNPNQVVRMGSAS